MNLALLRVALLPVDVDDLLEAAVNGIRGQQTLGILIGAGQADLGVDVHRAIGTARRPDNGRHVGLVVHQVILVKRAHPGGGGAGLITTGILASSKA